jgi:hypothetical protein
MTLSADIPAIHHASSPELVVINDFSAAFSPEFVVINDFYRGFSRC